MARVIHIAEATGEPVELDFAGRTFTLPTEFPFEVSELWGEGKAREGIALLFGDQAPAFWALKPSTAQMAKLLQGLAEVYGFETPGESSASNGSSPNISNRSRPTSPVTTG